MTSTPEPMAPKDNDRDIDENHAEANISDPNSYKNADRTLYHLPPLPACETYHTEEDYDMDALAETLETDGVVVIPRVFSKVQIESFRKAHDRNFARVANLISRAEQYEKPYRHDFDTKRYYVMPHYQIYDDQGEGWEEVIEISPGRLDYTFGMNPDDSDEDSDDEESDSDATNVFASVDFQRPKILAQLMERMLKADFRSYAGALPSAGSSRDGPWHRDVYLMFDDETVDVNLPHPYYYTVLIPLVAVDAQNGATQFLLGSHKQTCEQALSENRSYQPSAEPGDMIVFDGRICHRGRENKTDSDRTVLYMVWTKKWYNDY